MKMGNMIIKNTAVFFSAPLRCAQDDRNGRLQKRGMTGTGDDAPGMTGTVPFLRHVILSGEERKECAAFFTFLTAEGSCNPSSVIRAD